MSWSGQSDNMALAHSGGPSLLSMTPFASHSKSSLITLEQSILPGFIPPKPLDRVLKGMQHAL